MPKDDPINMDEGKPRSQEPGEPNAGLNDSGGGALETGKSQTGNGGEASNRGRTGDNGHSDVHTGDDGQASNDGQAGVKTNKLSDGSPYSNQDQAPQQEGKAKNLRQKIFREVIEVDIVIIYLAVCFSILETFRCATLLVKCSENDFLAGYATAGISALMLGKFVFILEKLRIMKRFKDKPIVVPVLYKTFLFTVLINFVLNAEDQIMHRPPAEYLVQTDPTKYWLCYFSHQLAFFVTFLIFFCIRELGAVLGEGRLFKLFFVSRDV